MNAICGHCCSHAQRPVHVHAVQLREAAIVCVQESGGDSINTNRVICACGSRWSAQLRVLIMMVEAARLPETSAMVAQWGCSHHEWLTLVAISAVVKNQDQSMRILRLVLENGAKVGTRTLQMALDSGNEEVIEAVSRTHEKESEPWYSQALQFLRLA
jgi:hypothetical protein